ncbi:MAG: AraC family transcriptional regulator [Paenibacillus sp.]|jgi:AraC-like DNA-binding protein|nr:AraC family transcriptional regulator [Paenibacillus sp.]
MMKGRKGWSLSGRIGERGVFMALDRSLINQSPSMNDAVCRWFEEFPIYLRHDFLSAHNFSMHTQPGIELNLTLEGQGTFVVDKNILRQSPGQLLVFPGKMPHQVFIDPSDLYTRMVVLIDDRSLSSLMPGRDFDWLSDVSCHQIRLQPDTYMTMKHLLFMMHKEMRERKIGWQQMIVSGLMNLTVLVRRCLEAGQTLQGSPGKRKPGRRAGENPISQLCQYIEQHLDGDLSLKTMADHFQLSPDHLIRTFKKEKGMTYHQYVLLQRVFESKRLLLQQSEMSLTDIAYSVGFASSSQFSKTFKNITGQTPSAFQQQVQTNIP